ncbi:MAG: hypothetical protein WAY93_03470 [Atopobiaceae bacterium]|nr:hypothetical protein [Atopobiaceae bacterium]
MGDSASLTLPSDQAIQLAPIDVIVVTDDQIASVCQYANNGGASDAATAQALKDAAAVAAAQQAQEEAAKKAACHISLDLCEFDVPESWAGKFEVKSESGAYSVVHTSAGSKEPPLIGVSVATPKQKHDLDGSSAHHDYHYYARPDGNCLLFSRFFFNEGVNYMPGDYTDVQVADIKSMLSDANREYVRSSLVVK